jgi:hypothetical protein
MHNTRVLFVLTTFESYKLTILYVTYSHIQLGLLINMRTFHMWEISRLVNDLTRKKLILPVKTLWCSTIFCQIKKFG